MDKLQELTKEKGRLRRLNALTLGAYTKSKRVVESLVKGIKVADSNIERSRKISNKDYLKAQAEKDNLVVKLKEQEIDMGIKHEEYKKIFVRQRENLNERRKIINDYAEGQQRQEMQKMQEGKI